MTKWVVIDGKRVQRGRKSDRQKADESYDVNFDDFKKHVARLATKKEAKAPIMALYKEMLRLEKSLSQEKTGITGDELTGMMLAAEAELREGGYL